MLAESADENLAHDGRAGCAAIYIGAEQGASFDFQGLLAHARKTLPRYAVPVFLRVMQQQTLGHNNKQNKVPLRNEGVDLHKISGGQAGPKDVIYWIPPKSETYRQFTAADWASIGAGQARL